MPPLEGDSVMPHPVSSLLLISGLHDCDIDDIQKKIMRGWGIGVSHTVYFAKVIAL